MERDVRKDGYEELRKLRFQSVVVRDTRKPMGNNARKLKARKVEIGRVGPATSEVANHLVLSDRDLNGLQGWSTSRLTNIPYRLLIHEIDPGSLCRYLFIRG